MKLDPSALRGTSAALSSTILTLVPQATAQADQRAKNAIAHALDDLSPEELATLGPTQETSLTEGVENTTPDSWRE